MIKRVIVTLLTLISVAHAEPPSNVQAEVNFLLGYVEGSGCAFYRNGTWHDSKEGQAHLRVLFEQSVDELSEVNEIIELRVGRFPLPRGKKSASTDCSNTTHLRDKYKWLVARNLINTTEDFIERAATESSLTGLDYQVKCNGAPKITSNKWLHDELIYIRTDGHF